MKKVTKTAAPKPTKNQNPVALGVIAITLVVAIVLTIMFITTERGIYKEGTYFGNSGTETAVIYVNNHGVIKSVFIDAPYVQYANGACKYTETSHGATKCVSTTKQILGNDYGMKAASEIGLEWNEQANAFAAKVVEEQGLEWLTVNLDESTDSISSVTMSVKGIATAVQKAIDQAKK